MSSYFPILFIAIVFGCMSIFFLVVLVFGILIRSLIVKLIGGITLCGSLSLVSQCMTACLYVYISFVFGPDTKTKPDPQDLVGVYRPTEEAVRYISKRSSFPISETFITLSADGAFEIKNVPSEWLDWSREARTRLGSGDGKWALDSKPFMGTRRWGLTLSFSYSEGLKPGSKNDRFVCGMLSLRNQRPPYSIYMTLGDPDAGRGLKFDLSGTKKKLTYPLLSYLFKAVRAILILGI